MIFFTAPLPVTFIDLQGQFSNFSYFKLC